MLEGQSSSSDGLQIGDEISGRYVIEKRLGAGGMGAVFLAVDKVLEDSKVAIKILHKDLCSDGELAKRFLREVKLMHSVNHPNVVRTYDVGRDKDIIYFTMEYLPGASLDRLLSRDKQLPIPTIVHVTEQVCAALNAIHQAEIVHRDLKPGNIIISEDQAIKLTDFGVARPKGSNLTQHNEIIGSVEYMAPEVWLGKGMTPAIDFYSLGIIMYLLTTGKVPFESDEPASLMWMHVKKPPPPPKQLRPDVPNWLNNLILKLLAKAPSDRPKSAAEILNYLNNHAKRGMRSGDDHQAIGTGTYQAMGGTGTFQAIGSGTHAATTGTTSGSYPQTVRIRGPRPQPRKKSSGFKIWYALVGTFAVLGLVTMNRFMRLLMDLFPY